MSHPLEKKLLRTYFNIRKLEQENGKKILIVKEENNL